MTPTCIELYGYKMKKLKKDEPIMKKKPVSVSNEVELIDMETTPIFIHRINDQIKQQQNRICCCCCCCGSMYVICILVCCFYRRFRYYK